jgi:hypothetical protein
MAGISDERLEELEADLARASALAPLPWKNDQPELWVQSAPTTDGRSMHVADIRGWGHLTGRGGGMALEDDVAFQHQKDWAALIVSAVNALPALIAELKALRGGQRDPSPPNGD